MGGVGYKVTRESDDFLQSDTAAAKVEDSDDKDLVIGLRSETPVFAMIWLLSYYCVLSDEVPPHFSTPLHAIARSIHFLFLPCKL